MALNFICLATGELEVPGPNKLATFYQYKDGLANPSPKIFSLNFSIDLPNEYQDFHPDFDPSAQVEITFDMLIEIGSSIDILYIGDNGEHIECIWECPPT